MEQDKKISSNDGPLVSVIIPAYNCSQYVAETVGSVLSQTYQNFEIIVINDGSKDEDKLKLELEQFGDKVIFLERENGGPGAARNTGIAIAKGELLGFLDGDDIWLPKFLEDSVRLMKENSWDMIYSDALMFGDVRDGLLYSETAPTAGEINTESIIRGTINVILSGTVVRTSAVEKCGSFREVRTDMSNQDFDLWFKLAKNGYKIGHNPSVRLKYRVHESNMSGGMRQIAERGVRGMQYFREEYDLTDAEKAAVDDREKELYSQVMIEKAKIQLAQQNYQDSIISVSEGRKAYGGGKLYIIESFMRISPQVARMVFKRFRRREFDRAIKESLSHI